MSTLREEFVGHCTLAVMGLLGLGFYSASYALLYTFTPQPANAHGKAVVPAVLEMWMVFTHLVVSAGCCALQVLLAGVVRLTQPVPHLAEAQSALFLGVALTVTLLAATCINGGQGECALYFGAATLPRIAAVGAATWGWIMYLSALACQTTLRRLDPLTVATVVAFVPWLMERTAVNTCGDAWRLHVCTAIEVTLVANGTQSTVQADCGLLDLGVWVLGLGVLLGALAAQLPHALVRLGGAVVATVAVVGVWSLLPTPGARVTPTSTYFGTLLALTLMAAVDAVWQLLHAGGRGGAAMNATSGRGTNRRGNGNRPASSVMSRVSMRAPTTAMGRFPTPLVGPSATNNHNHNNNNSTTTTTPVASVAEPSAARLFLKNTRKSQ